MKAQPPSVLFRPINREQLFAERRHDTYKLERKPPEPARCPDCGAVFRAGRWQWGEAAADAAELVCSACHRIRDRFPAGYLYLEGSFVSTHREEILSVMRKHEQRAMERIMEIADDEAGLRVTTTDIHLARDIGEALHRAYRGELEFHYNEAENLLRVHWLR